MSNTQTHTDQGTGILLTVDRIAEVTGLPRAAIYLVSERRKLGSPGHYIYAHGIVVYTPAGLGQLAEGLEEEHATAAKALRYEMHLARERAGRAGGLSASDAEARRIAARWDQVLERREEDAA